jgi:aspartyl-tRNA(Asn)/glutamyl-tRNA(Gln) amidotransferase subunit A
MMDEVMNSGILETVIKLKSREISPVELTKAYLDRIEALNPLLNAYLTVMADEALKQAQQAENAILRGEPTGPLCGVPMALKDNIDVKGVKMTAGSKFFADNVSASDAEVTKRLRDTGAIFLGKLNMHEWALGGTSRNPHYGAVKNPWDTDRIPGGSSGGSAAALAADMALASLGTDTGGSVRVPASLNGICGLRPTYGRISTRGVVPVSGSLDSIGPMARRARDIGLLFNILAGYDPLDPTSSNKPVPYYTYGLHTEIKSLRIGVLGGYFQSASEDIQSLVNEAIKIFRNLGAEIDHVELQHVDEAFERTSDFILSDAAAFHHDRIIEKADMFGLDVLTRLRVGMNLTGVQTSNVLEMQRRWIRQLSNVLDKYDLLITPTCPTIPPLIKDTEGVKSTRDIMRFTYPFSLSLLPSISIPCGFSKEGLPVGMQLIGGKWKENLLIYAAECFQEVSDWHTRRPVIIQ